jgi:hypothetical protein
VKKVSLRVVFFIFVLLGVFCFQALAQEATIVGTVTDPSGAAIPNANITATNTNTGQSRSTTTNSVGQYLLPGLQIGSYTVRAEVAGFKKAEKTGLGLEVGARARVDFALEIGTAQESVTVEATPVAVQSESGEVSDVITGTQVTQLATNGRTIYSLAALVPGASSNMPDSQTPTAVAGNAEISFNGLRSSHNIYLIDGGENLDRGGAGTLSVMPSVDAIGEFRQMTSNYSAEYGLSSAATFTMVFRSGVKQFHAAAWEFLRNEDLDANTFFRNAAKVKRPVNRLNTYGFNVGGPVFIPRVYNKEKDKTFFFYNMEWRKALTGGALNTVVPPTSAYGGNLGSTAIHTPYECQVSSTIAAQYAAAGLALSGCTGGSPDSSKVVNFPNNTIPASLLNPQAQIILGTGVFPAATVGNRFVGGNNAPTNVREEIVRIDQHFADKLWLFGHFVADAIDQNFGTTMWSGDNVPSASNTFGNPAYSGVIHATATISPTVLNEIAFNYNGNRINILPGANAVVSRPSNLNVPELFPGNALDRLPSLNLAGSTGTNYTLNWIPWTNKADDYQIRDDFSWTKGSHQLKFGFSWAIYKKIQTYFANTEGNLTFNGVYSGNDFADFLLGYASGYSEDAYQGAGHWDNQSWAMYVQDNWKVTPRLTLNLGLRWDGIPHTYEESNYHSNFYPELYNAANRAVLCGGQICSDSPGLGTSPIPAMAGLKLYLNGIGIAGQNGVPTGLVDAAWANFGPRVGFAYDITGSGKTVIRGGFGIMYERIQGNDMYNGATNPPFGATVQFNNVNLSNPQQSLLTGQTLVAPVTINNLTGLYETDYAPPTSTQYSIGVQRELFKNSVLSVTYVGNQNRHQNSYTDINLPATSSLAGIINGTVARNTVVPYLGWGQLRMSGNNLNSHYNGLQMSFQSQVRDLSLQVAYTYSKAFDPSNQSGGLGDMNNVGNSYDRSYDYGPSALDRRNIFLANFIYKLPILRGNSGNRALRATLGGWEISGIVVAQSGFPLQITEGGSKGSNGLAFGTNRPNVSGSVGYPNELTQWFDTSKFSSPAAGTWGNFPKNTVYGPGRHNWNLALFKSFTFSEERGSRLELRFETFNTFNHTQWSTISSSRSASNFGQVTGTYNPRNIQLAAKLYF